jgi:hypothetical protein
VTLLAAASCSLTGITDIEVGKCETDKECTDALNPDEGFYADCAAFLCVNKKCEPVGGEICDGLDNDCDYLIDELLTAERSEFLSGTTTVETMTVARSAALSRVYLQHADAKVSSVDPESGDSAQVRMLAQASNDELDTELSEGCVTTTASTPSECNFNQTAVAGGARLGYFAQIASNTCKGGELRVGVIDPEEDQAGLSGFIDRGPGFRNPAYRGVATDGSLCSNNGRSDCIQAKADYLAMVNEGASASALNDARDLVTQSCGVSHPSIAAVGAQALVGYLGVPLTSSVCGGDPVDVLGLLIHGRVGLRDGEFSWGDPSGNGVPSSCRTTPPRNTQLQKSQPLENDHLPRSR